MSEVIVAADVATWLAANGARYGTRVALTDGVETVTYAELASRVRAIRASVDLRQLAPGAVVALSADATVAGVATLLALIVADVVAAPLNVRLTAGELTAYLDRIQPALLLSDPSHAAATLGRDWLDLGRPELDWPGLEGAALDEVSRSAPPSIDTAQPMMSVPCIAFPTGGTTGLPKAALWTQDGLALAIGSSVDNLVVGAGDTELYISPIFHVTIIPGFLATLAAGGTVMLQPRFDAAAAAEAIESGQITRMFGTPTAVSRIFDHMHGPQPDNSMELIYGAARSSDPFRARVREMLPRASVYSGYGATEVGAVVRLKPEHGDGDRGVGRPVSGVRITIVDPDDQPVPTGERGDVAVFSPFACIGYLGAETAGPQRLADGSVITGDVGWLDEDGFLHLDGRRTEMIKTGGENVFPAEVEAVLLSHPAVRDAAVFGVVDAEWGEKVRALVVLDAPLIDECGSEAASELIAFCRDRLAGYKVPKQIDFTDDLPMTASLKIDRSAVGQVGISVLTLERTAEQTAFASSVTAALTKQPLPRGSTPDDVWRTLGELGLFGIGTPHVGGGTADMVAGMRSAGSAGCQGPFLGALLAGRVLGDDSESIDDIIAGAARVSLVSDGVAAWGVGAGLYLEVGDDGVISTATIASLEPIRTLADESWARVTVSGRRPLGERPLDIAFVELARAAWVVGAGETLLGLAADHARDRQQFGKPIGDFQAVSHPLASAAAELGAASDSIALAAWRLDHESNPVPCARASLAATRAALQTAYASHQAHGAIGFTRERGLDRLSTGIRQMSLHPPGPSQARATSLQGWLP